VTPPIFPRNLLSGRIIHTVLFSYIQQFVMKRLKTSKTTAQGNSWVPYFQRSNVVMISPKKLDSVTVISRGEN
jgi:hypothetical protein